MLGFSTVTGHRLQYLGEALPPGEEVGVVLVGACEYNPSLDTTTITLFFFQASKDVGSEEGGYSDSNDFLEPLNGRCGPGATEEQRMLFCRSAQLLPDVRLGLMDHPAHHPPDIAVLGVGVPCSIHLNK